MFTNTAKRKLCALFPAELSDTRRHLTTLVKTDETLSTCDQLYDDVFKQIIHDYPNYTKSQFDLLLTSLSTAIKKTECLYRQLSTVPRMACVILLKRLQLISRLLFLKEIAKKDIKTFHLDINATIPVRNTLENFEVDYKQLLNSCKKTACFFSEYHIDFNQPTPPNLEECRSLLNDPSQAYLLSWQSQTVSQSSDNENTPLLGSAKF